MSNAASLGRFILVSNPYPTQTAPGTFPAPAVAPILNPPADTVLDKRFGLCLDEVESQEYAGRWDFKGTSHYVAKAIRIPYMYYRPSTDGTSAVLVTDYLLIGFEGGGAM
jgi:hypothetical protein